MKNQIKAKAIHFISFLIIFICVYFSLLNFIESIDSTVIAGITAFISIVFSPKTKVIEAQSGEKIQITWIFLKKPILI
jgi:hypothetical protein